MKKLIALVPLLFACSPPSGPQPSNQQNIDIVTFVYCHKMHECNEAGFFLRYPAGQSDCITQFDAGATHCSFEQSSNCQDAINQSACLPDGGPEFPFICNGC